MTEHSPKEPPEMTFLDIREPSLDAGLEGWERYLKEIEALQADPQVKKELAHYAKFMIERIRSSLN
jgi:hypothetical protein